MQKEDKKIGLFSCICVAIGIVVGAGIFGALPVAVDITGKGVVLAFILAAVTIVLRYYPTIITGAAIPASFGYYMHTTRLGGPHLGFTQVIASFSTVFVQAILATVFAMYFSALVPIDTRIISVAVLLIFGAITCAGIKASGAVQNFMVILLLSALFTYIIGGLPNIDPENLALVEIFFPPNQSFFSIGAAIGLLSSCLMGGYIVMNFSDEIKNPGKAIPVTFIVSTSLTAFVYVLLSIVTIGVMPAKSAPTLATVADKFMSPGLKMFFITGGALFASLTTINSTFLSGSRTLAVVARDKVIPEWFTRKNRFGVPQNSVLFLTLIPAVITAFGISIGTLLSAFSILTILFGIILFIPVIRLPKRYPYSYKNSYLKLSQSMIWVFVILGTIVSLYQIYSLVIAMDTATWIALVIWVLFWYGYFFMRKAYLMKKGVDLTAIMSAPYRPWEEKEKELRSNGKNEI